MAEAALWVRISRADYLALRASGATLELTEFADDNATQVKIVRGCGPAAPALPPLRKQGAGVRRYLVRDDQITAA